MFRVSKGSSGEGPSDDDRFRNLTLFDEAGVACCLADRVSLVVNLTKLLLEVKVFHRTTFIIILATVGDIHVQLLCQNIRLYVM